MNTYSPLISVIVPVYNASDTLQRCIESIFQFSPPKTEIILIDDGSNDGSSDLCDRFAEDSRVKVLHKSNGGVSSARNLGLKVACGDYILFVDSDDALCDMVPYDILSEGYEIILTNTICGTKDGKNICLRQFEPIVINGKPEVSTFFSSNINANLLRGPIGKFFRRDMLSGIEYPLGMRWGEDLIFNMLSFARCNSLCVFDASIYHVFFQTTTTNKYPLSVKEAVRYLLEQYNIYRKCGYNNPEFEQLNFIYLKNLCDEDMKVNFMHWFGNKDIKDYWARIKHSFDFKFRMKYFLLPYVYTARKLKRSLFK